MPKNVENFEIRTLGRDDYAQAAKIFAFVHALHQANRPDIYRKTNVPLDEDEFFFFFCLGMGCVLYNYYKCYLDVLYKYHKFPMYIFPVPDIRSVVFQQ